MKRLAWGAAVIACIVGHALQEETTGGKTNGDHRLDRRGDPFRGLVVGGQWAWPTCYVVLPNTRVTPAVS